VYVRIARFEGAEGDQEQQIAEVRQQMAAGMREQVIPVKRGLMLVDRKNGTGASVLFCESEDDLRQVDEYMNSMNPSGPGSRVSVDMYEVAVDSDEL
jgi:hypothetical protein